MLHGVILVAAFGCCMMYFTCQCSSVLCAAACEIMYVYISTWLGVSLADSNTNVHAGRCLRLPATSNAKKTFFFCSIFIFLFFYFFICLFVKKMIYWYTSEMHYHLFIKYLWEQNVINICNNDIITGILSHYLHGIHNYGLTPI